MKTVARFLRLFDISIVCSLLLSPALWASDCNRNGVADSLDIASGSSRDCNENLVPDECDVRPVNTSVALRSDMSVSAISQWLIAADMNGDGWADLITIDRSVVSISVLFNQGERPRLGAERRYPVASEPRGAVVHDLDGDGDLDIAVSNKYVGWVSILRNHGDGILEDAGAFRTGGWSVALVSADLSGDGVADLAAVNEDSMSLVVLRGTGAASFAAPEPYLLFDAPVFDNASCLDAGDVDGDGDTDLVVASGVMGTQFKNLGNGTFETSPTPIPGQSARLVDLDGDAILDLVQADPAVYVSLNPGSGSFDVASTYSVNGEPHSVTPVDLDGDARIDLVTTNPSDSSLSVLMNAGGGRFSPPRRAEAGPHPGYVAAADFDRDGVPELAIGHPFDDSTDPVVVSGRTLVALSDDCDHNGVPEECELESESDCNQNGLRDACEPDCNRNGRPDDCDVGFGISTDCNMNGLPDECEPPTGLNVDQNQDGVVEPCEGASVYFAFGFRDAVEVMGEAGETLATVTGQLRSRVTWLADEGAQAWAIGIGASGCEITGATTSGTTAAPVTQGGFLDEGFERTDLIRDRRTRELYVVSAVVLSFTKPVTLKPSQSPHDVIRVTVEAPGGVDGPCESCLLRYVNFSYGEAYITNSITFQGNTVNASRGWKSFDLCPVRFRRGDTNTDGRVDISDAVRTFMYLFLGASEPKCLDAADANDDAKIDISDGLAILLDFFIPEDTRIPPPGPFACGADPSPDGLGCAEYTPCEVGTTR